MAGGVVENEQQFWQEHGQSFDEALAEYAKGPDPNSRLMLDSLEPLEGMTVLDVACGSGVTTAWLADRGALPVGVDVTDQSIATAAALCEHVGAAAQFELADLNCSIEKLPTFDRIAGRYALHHLNIPVAVPALAGRLNDRGKGAFVETVDSNWLLRVARKHLVGRMGIPSFGSIDEHPLTSDELQVIRDSFGDLQIGLAEMVVFRIFDRQVLRFKSPLGSRLCSQLDGLLYATSRYSLSYRQVVIVQKAT